MLGPSEKSRAGLFQPNPAPRNVAVLFSSSLPLRSGHTATGTDPPIVRLVARAEPDGDGRAVFDVSELSERLRRRYNRTIREKGE